ncbi:hypothetical protein FRC02_006221 [Tulasnella sp. 418]|nr:hypothetical protein FRC02_006221 [Tulasnella sp. 418]
MSSNTPRIAPAPPRPSDPVSPDSNDSNLPGPSKRKSEALSAPKKRARVSYSCQECHRRKQKCDRQVPCGHCVARKVPELCKNYQPGKTEDFSARLARIEHIIEIALPQYANADFTNPPSPLPLSASLPGQIHESPNGHDLSTNGIWNHPSLQQPNDLDMTVNPSDRDRARSVSSSPSGSHKEEEHEPSGGTLQSGRWFGTSALGSVNEHPILDQLQSNPALQPVIEDASISDRLKSLVQDCGVPPHQLSELVQDLPPKPLSDVLIDHYFASVNYTRYPLHEPSFRNNYESVCQNGMNVQLNDIRFLPLLFVVLAIAARLAPENILGDDRQRRITSLRYYWSSRKSLLISCAVQTDSFEMILLRLLSIRFLTFDRRITECWAQLGAAVRTAHALGLHRDPAKMVGVHVRYSLSARN